MAKLTTHVLDTTRGKPGRGIVVALYRIEGEQRVLKRRMVTNSDGRCDEPMLADGEMTPDVFELVFSVGPYFAALEPAKVANGNTGPRFLDDVVIRFGISAPEEHYHVPLLITPFSYSTYRGS
jgi:5-hydroxyisourate hydrolase